MEFGPSFGRMSVEAARAKGETLRGLVNERLKKLGPGKGVLFAIDEAQSVSIEELAALAVLYQQVLGDQDATACPIATSAVLRWRSPACPVWLTICSKSRA